MISSFFKSGARPIGCWVSGRAVRLAQLLPSRSSSPRFVTATAELPSSFPEDAAAWSDDVARTVRTCLASASFKGHDVVTCPAESLIRYHHLCMANMSDDEMDTAVFWQTAKELSWRSEDLRSAFFDVGSTVENGISRREVIAVAASLRAMDSHAESVTHAGLTPLGIDVLPAALARCVSHPGENQAQLLIVIGHASALFMVARDGHPTFIRSVGGGRRWLVERAMCTTGDHCSDPKMLWDVIGDEFSATGDESGGGECHRALETACGMYATELSHEVGLCLHHLATNTIASDQPRTGCIVGAGRQEHAFLNALGSDIEFLPLDKAISPSMHSALADIEPKACVDAWLPALGLAMYGCDATAKQVAA